MNDYYLSDQDQEEFYNLTLNLDYVLGRMTYQHKVALFLYYWQRKTVREVANTLHMSWEKADKLIDDAYTELRHLVFIAEHLKEASGY